MKRAFRILLVVGSIILGLLIVLVALPVLFEDDLKAMLKEEVNKQLLATVEFEDLDLSFIRSFPNASISLSNYSVANQGPFEGDTLIQGDEFSLVVNLMSIFKGETYEIKSVSLLRPVVDVHVLPDGSVNYDITKPAAPDTETEEATSAFQLALNRYLLEDADIRYRDESLPMFSHIEHLFHSGKGDFSDVDFLLETTTKASRVDLSYDGTQYLAGLPIEAEVDLNIHAGDVFSVEMKDNSFLINRFPLTASGTVAMPGDDITMDLAFASPGSDFGTLLSLVPTAFKTDLAGLTTRGNLVFDGALKGTYNETSFPGYRLRLGVSDAFIQYPDLPESISNIALDLEVKNTDGRDESLIVDLNTFTANLGTNPIAASLHLENLVTPYLKGNAQAKVNLAQIASVYPIEGTDLAGMFSLDADAEGKYDEASGSFPRVTAAMTMTDGMVKSKEYNTELTQLNFEGTLTDPDGSLTNAVLDMPTFHFLLDGTPMDGSVKVSNFDDPAYELTARGGLDLGKLYQLYPIDSMELSGVLTVNDLYASGVYSDVEAERYDKLVNRGSVEIESLFYRDLWYTQPGITLSKGSAQFTPQKLSFQGMEGKLGKSVFSGSGYLTNYLAYLLMGSEELQGQIAMASPFFDTNEWLAAEESSTSTSSTPAAEEVALEIYQIPAGYDLLIDLNMDKVAYDDLILEQVKGTTQIKDQQMLLEDLTFRMLGSDVSMGGTYDTQNKKKAGYNFFLDVSNLGVKDAFKYFSTVQAFAPVAQFISGNCNLEIGLKGGLKPDFSPILEDLNAFGLFELLEGGLSQTPVTQALASNTNISELKTMSLKDIKGMFKVENGTLTFEPFDIKLGNMLLSLGGAQNLAGGIRYDVKIDAPAGSLGTAAFQSLGKLTGGALNPGERVEVNLIVSGTAKDPKISGAGGGTASLLKDQATSALEGELNDKLGTDISLNKDSLKAQANAAKQRAEDSLRTLANQAKQQAKDTIAALADSAKIRAQQALEEELKKQAGEDVTEKLKDLKEKIKLPARRKP
ncbi:MAG: hypothetical protein NWR72_13785 [Bacteroidia bacterium]|nr:hypothetical protein [Bacteroidia bacterium]